MLLAALWAVRPFLLSLGLVLLVGMGGLIARAASQAGKAQDGEKGEDGAKGKHGMHFFFVLKDKKRRAVTAGLMKTSFFVSCKR